MTRLARLHSHEDFRRAARRRLPRGLFEFVDRGTGTDAAVRNNAHAFDRVRLMPRGLGHAAPASTATRLFGQPVAMPLVIAPTGAAGVIWPQGDLALARAARQAGVPATLAMRSLSAPEEVTAQGGQTWFQLYPGGARSLVAELLARVSGAGIEVLIVTVDTPVTPRRTYNTANGFSLPFRPNRTALLDMARRPRWLAGLARQILAARDLPRFETMPGRPTVLAGPEASAMLARPGPDDLAWLRDQWRGKLLLKGVLHPEDALAAADLGADGLVVSNHGGRNLDAAVAPVEALGEIAREVGSRMLVLVDGGVRSGLDIVRACARGAHGVMIGRAALYGLAVGGESGAAALLAMLQAEMENAMAMLGVGCVADIGPGLLFESAGSRGGP